MPTEQRPSIAESRAIRAEAERQEQARARILRTFDRGGRTLSQITTPRELERAFMPDHADQLQELQLRDSERRAQREEKAEARQRAEELQAETRAVLDEWQREREAEAKAEA